MKLSVLASVAAFLVSAQGLEIFKRPTLDDAARIARTLISRESLVNINTVYQSGDEQGLPTSFVEYYADCGDGNPIILAVDIGTSFRNINNGSPVTLTVRTGDHAFKEEVSRKYPGSRPDSVAGSPRINLRGEFKAIESGDEYDALEKCFLSRHKDAAWWLPGNPIHKSHFVKFDVKDAYFLGGFGDTGYIGKIPSEDYHKAELLDDIVDGQNVNIQRTGDENIRDYAFEAYMMKHNIKDLTRSFYSKISTQVDYFKALVDGETSEENVILDLSTEESQTVLEIVQSKFEKRDELDLSNLNIKELSKEQLSKIIEELETLKTQIFQYGEEVLAKLPVGENPQPQEGDEQPQPPKDGDRPPPPPFKGPEDGEEPPRGPPRDGDRPPPPPRGPPKDGDRPPPPPRGPPKDGDRPPPPPKDGEEPPRGPPKDGDRPHPPPRGPPRGPPKDGDRPPPPPHHGDDDDEHDEKRFKKHGKHHKNGKHGEGKHHDRPHHKSGKKHDDDEEQKPLFSFKSLFGLREPKPEHVGERRGPHHEEEGREHDFEHKEHREHREHRGGFKGEHRGPREHREHREHRDDFKGEQREPKEFRGEFKGEHREHRGEFRGEHRGEFRGEHRGEFKGEHRGEFKGEHRGPKEFKGEHRQPKEFEGEHKGEHKEFRGDRHHQERIGQEPQHEFKDDITIVLIDEQKQ